MDYAKRVIKVKNECENIKKFLLGLGYVKWGTNTKIIVNHQDKIILLYTKTNSAKNKDSLLTSLIETCTILPGYTLIYGYLKSTRVGDENITQVFNDNNIEIVSGLALLKRVFGVAYDLYLDNCKKYISSKLSLGGGTSGTRNAIEVTGLSPSETLTLQMNNSGSTARYPQIDQ